MTRDCYSGKDSKHASAAVQPVSRQKHLGANNNRRSRRKVKKGFKAAAL